MSTPDRARQLDALAKALRHIARETTTLRRSVSADAQRLLELEGAIDAAVRSLRRLQRHTPERP